MSNMNLLEATARYSEAMSILNSFRHWLTGREGANLDYNDVEVFLESVDMNQDQKLSSKMLLYSFQGFNNEHSPAIELSEALSNALATTFEPEEREEHLSHLRMILESKDKNIDESQKDSIIKLIVNTMQIISNETEKSPRNIFPWKTL